MAVEGKGGARPIWEKIEQEVGDVSFDAKTEVKGSSESRAEELFALWRDYRRALQGVQKFDRSEEAKEREDQTYKPQEFSDETVLAKIEKLKQSIAERWHEPETQKLFKDNIQKSVDEAVGTQTDAQDFEKTQRSHTEHTLEREKLYQQIFQHREQDPDELTQISLAELSTQIKTEKRTLTTKEAKSPELAAQLSFDRLKDYRKQLSKDGFMWTPSREEYFRRIVDHLVIVNQNRPLLLSGETGTGKTRLARAVSKRLTGKNPFEVGEEAKTDIRPLLGSRMVDQERGTYVNYGQLGQALTGKKNSLDKEADAGGIFYMDEMNGYPPDALRSLIKQISGRRTGEEVTFAAWYGNKERIAPKFGFLGSANLPSEKHPDRSDLPVEVARELGEMEVDYPPQTPKNPELYEMMLASLMDQNNRIRLPRAELAPAYEDKFDSPTIEKQKELNIEPGAGGTLWRFANLVADVQRSYKGEANSLTPDNQDASYLRAAVLDPGLVLSWLQAYRKSASRREVDLHSFLADKLEAWADQKIYPEEDRNLMRKFFTKFNLNSPGHPLSYEQTILSPSEIGALSPRVPQRGELLEDAPPPADSIEYMPDGTTVSFNDRSSQVKGGLRMVKSSDRAKKVWTFLGWGQKEHDGQAVMKDDAGKIMLISMVEWDTQWAAAYGSYSERYEGREVRIDIRETWQSSEKFYKEHNLQEFADNLPKDVRFSQEGEARIREALKMGFDRAIILPQAEFQHQRMDKLAAELANKKLKGIPDADPNQYSQDGYFEDAGSANDVKKATTKNRPQGKAYMLLYQSKPIPQETKSKNPDQLDQLFAQKKWNGMTLSEYLVLQRKEAEERGDHTFDEYSDTAQKSQWTWLLDSNIGSDKVVHAGWHPGNRQVNVSWSNRSNSNEGLGARPVVVVEIL